jgi:SAM-dependent methyltransferase
MRKLEIWIDENLQRTSADSVLEFGSGNTFVFAKAFGKYFSRICATDIETIEFGAIPPGVQFRRCSTDRIPFAAEEFDVVLIRSVVEHLSDPRATFNEIARVLKPGGRVLMDLPNRWDYVSLFALFAGRFKSVILRVFLQASWRDYPVYYRCNTRSALQRALRSSGLFIESFEPLAIGPSYLAFFVPLYVVGVFYQFAISLLLLDFLQPVFLVSLRKNAADSSRPRGLC